MKSFCHGLPKVELHAHLNGSLRPNCITKLQVLYQEQFKDEPVPRFDQNTPGMEGFDSAFAIFPLAQKLTRSPEALRIATRCVFEDFAADNVKYMEIRSTPRAVEGVMSKADYIKAIVDEIRAINNQPELDIQGRLLISIDRRQSVEYAKDTLSLCKQFQNRYPDVVVGLDLSGDARQGDLRQFLEVFKDAQDSGLKLTVHCAEVPNPDEVTFILKTIRPHRIGHGTAIHPSCGGSTSLWISLKESQIPTEVCVTSNVFCKSIPSVQDHHVKHLLDERMPLALCTDDVGLLNNSLSLEYEKVQASLNLSKQDLFDISKATIDLTFAEDDTKTSLLNNWQRFYESVMVKK